LRPVWPRAAAPPPPPTPGATIDVPAADPDAVDYAAILGDRYDDAFPDDRVLTVRVLMDSADWAAMQANIQAKEYYKADIWIDDELLQDVAIRTKGSSSLMAAARAGTFRAGLKVDFNFFNQARSYRGVKKVVYNNGFSDPTLMKEFLGYELMAEMGVPTPRACFVDLWVNDTHLGVYTQVEAVDGTFVSDHFDDANGNLYKPEIAAGRLNWTEADAVAQTDRASVAPTTTTSESFNVGGGDLGEIIERVGDDAGWIPGRLDTPAGDLSTSTAVRGPGGMMGGGPPGFMNANSDYLVSVGLKTNEEKADYSRLYELLEVLNSDPAEVSAQDLKRMIDVDETLRFLAVSVALVHLDNYIGMGHNYYLYDEAGVFSIVPWDLNMTFGGFDSGLSERKIFDFYIDEPTSAAMSNYPLIEQLMDEPEFVAIYHGYLKQLIEGPFSLEHMTARINEIAGVIRPYVQKDDNLLFSVEAFEQGLTSNLTASTGATGNRMGGTFIGLTRFVQARTASIAAQLAGTQASSAGDGSGNGGSIGPGGMGGGFPGGGNLPGGGQQGGPPGGNAPAGAPQGGPPGGGQRPSTTTTTGV
jgi:spore coat protein CotH